MSYTEFAQKLDMDESNFHRYLTERVPSTRFAVKIQKITMDKVKVEHWLQD